MRLEPKTILVVDDEEDVRSLVAEFLTEEGWIVQTAADGRQALPSFGTRHHAFRLRVITLRR